MKGGRARWRIENEVFNTLKNQGYHFEHNFGHGNQHLSNVFCIFDALIDQIQGLCCKLFQQAKTKMESNILFWERFRAYFFLVKLPDWVTLYKAICSLLVVELPVFDTS